MRFIRLPFFHPHTCIRAPRELSPTCIRAPREFPLLPQLVVEASCLHITGRTYPQVLHPHYPFPVNFCPRSGSTSPRSPRQFLSAQRVIFVRLQAGPSRYPLLVTRYHSSLLTTSCYLFTYSLLTTHYYFLSIYLLTTHYYLIGLVYNLSITFFLLLFPIPPKSSKFAMTRYARIPATRETPPPSTAGTN